MQLLVSTRVSLAWPPEPAREVTDTLVLSGRSGYFVDLRIFIEGSHVGEIEWATAGVKTALPCGPDGRERASFNAILDSRRASDESTSPEDEGSFSVLPNGDVLETGTMANPEAGGAVQPYEEVWRRLPVDEEARVVILQSFDGHAFIARVGDRELAVKDVEGEGFLARRMELSVDGSWSEIHCIGGSAAREALPRLPVEGIRDLIGEQVCLGGKRWIVRENS